LIAAYGYKELFQIVSSIVAVMSVAAVLKACAMGLQVWKGGTPTVEWRHAAKQVSAPSPNSGE
jgi:hypothetical protein